MEMADGRSELGNTNIEHSTSNIKSKGTAAVMFVAVGRDGALRRPRPKWAQAFRRLYRRGSRSAGQRDVPTGCTGHEGRSRNHRNPVGLYPMAMNGVMP